MNIPVFHDDQHGTAIISSAARCSTVWNWSAATSVDQGSRLRRRRRRHRLPNVMRVWASNAKHPWSSKGA